MVPITVCQEIVNFIIFFIATEVVIVDIHSWNSRMQKKQCWA